MRVAVLACLVAALILAAAGAAVTNFRSPRGDVACGYTDGIENGLGVNAVLCSRSSDGLALAVFDDGRLRKRVFSKNPNGTVIRPSHAYFIGPFPSADNRFGMTCITRGELDRGFLLGLRYGRWIN